MSKRNGMVTRSEVVVTYEAEIFSAYTRKIRKITDELVGVTDLSKIKEIAAKQIPDHEMIVTVTVTRKARRLYGMALDKYYQEAKILDEVEI